MTPPTTYQLDKSFFGLRLPQTAFLPIKSLQFPILSKKKIGLQKHIIVPNPTKIAYHDFGNYCCLLYSETIDTTSLVERFVKCLYPFTHYPESIYYTWQANSFFIFGTKQYKEQLQQLYQAATKKDLAIFLGDSELPFAQDGLNLLKVSALPPEVVRAHISREKALNELNSFLAEEKAEEKIKKLFPKLTFKFTLIGTHFKPANIKWHILEDDTFNKKGIYNYSDLTDWLQYEGKATKSAKIKANTIYSALTYSYNQQSEKYILYRKGWEYYIYTTNQARSFNIATSFHDTSFLDSLKELIEVPIQQILTHPQKKLREFARERLEESNSTGNTT